MLIGGRLRRTTRGPSEIEHDAWMVVTNFVARQRVFPRLKLRGPTLVSTRYISPTPR